MTSRLLLHGFTGRAASWAGFDGDAIDLPGHGCPVDREAGFEGGVAFVAAEIRRRGAPVHLVGYSLGGRLALGTCVAFPELVANATLIGANTGIDDDNRAARRTWETEVSSRLRRGDLAAFLDWWSRLPLFSTQAKLPVATLAAQDEIRRTNDPFALADAFEAFALSAMPDYRPRLATLDVPITFVAGALDDKYARIAEDAAARMENGRAVIVEGAGHNVPLERPEAIAQLISV